MIKIFFLVLFYFLVTFEFRLLIKYPSCVLSLIIKKRKIIEL